MEDKKIITLELTVEELNGIFQILGEVPNKYGVHKITDFLKMKAESPKASE